jgi:hypothetical protein
MNLPICSIDLAPVARVIVTTIGTNRRHRHYQQHCDHCHPQWMTTTRVLAVWKKILQSHQILGGRHYFWRRRLQFFRIAAPLAVPVLLSKEKVLAAAEA